MIPIDQLTNVAHAVRCATCGAWHNIEASTYLSIVGDIRLGGAFNVYPTNLDESGKVTRATILCRNEKCVQPLYEVISNADPDYEKIAERTRSWRSHFPDETPKTSSGVVMLTPAAMHSCEGGMLSVPLDADLPDLSELNDEQRRLLDSVVDDLLESAGPDADQDAVDRAISQQILSGEAMKQLDDVMPMDGTPVDSTTEVAPVADEMIAIAEDTEGTNPENVFDNNPQ